VRLDEPQLRLRALAQLPTAHAEAAGGRCQQVMDASGVVGQLGARQLVALAGGVPPHALHQLLERRQQPFLLDVAEDLVEDLVPGVIRRIGSDEDRGPGSVLVPVGVVEETQLRGHDDEALLRQPLLRPGGQLPLDEGAHAHRFERGRGLGAGIGRALRGQRHQLVVRERITADIGDLRRSRGGAGRQHRCPEEETEPPEPGPVHRNPCLSLPSRARCRGSLPP
jgi:hypothetical protein